MKDYFYPRTGDVDADGNPNACSSPSYMKDSPPTRARPGRR
jgi:hypothetical protein